MPSQPSERIDTARIKTLEVLEDAPSQSMFLGVLKERFIDNLWPALILGSLIAASLFIWHHSMIKALETRQEFQSQRLQRLQRVIDELPSQIDLTNQIETLSIRLQGMEASLKGIEESVKTHPQKK